MFNQMSAVSQAYLQFLRSEKEQILEKHFAWYSEF